MRVSFPQWKNALVATALLPVLDLLWFSIFRRVYRFEYTNVWYAACTWVLLGTSLSMPRPESTEEAAIAGAVFGLVVWGTFNGSYASITPTWTLPKVVLDVVWGCIVSVSLSVFLYALL